MMICNDVMPVLMTKSRYNWFYKNVGVYITLIDDLVYCYPLFLTILMVSERIYVLFRPFGRAFSNGKLWWYCSAIAIWDLVFVLTPFFKGCPVIFDYYSLSYVTECEHFFTFLFNDYNWVIPITCMFLNISIIFYVSYIRNKCQLNSDQMRRRREEKVMISQSIATTTFLITYEITEFIKCIFEKEYLALSEMAQRTIYYARDSAVGLTCFFIYFVGTPAIRKIVIDKILTSLLCMAPIIAGCPKSYDFNTSTVISDCEPIITTVFYKFNGFIPLVCMFLNIVSVAQRSREKTMYLQLILCTTILLAYTICARVIEVYSKEYMEFSESTRRTIDYMMNLTVCLRCFLIYFVGTSATRKIVLDKLFVLVEKKKKIGNTVVIMGSRDQSVNTLK
ncbi:unnamed protein product [Caenorhabditis nigoni]